MSELLRKKVTDDLIHDIIRQIVAGELPPGAPLLSVKALSAKYRISPQSVARGLKVLVRRGLVISRPRRGLFVSEKLRGGGIPHFRKIAIWIAASGLPPTASLHGAVLAGLLRAPLTKSCSFSMYFGSGAANEGLTPELVFHQTKPDGLITIGVQDQDLLRRLIELVQPVVAIDTFSTDPRIDAIRIDTTMPANRMVQDLIHLGHRRIGFIGSLREDGEVDQNSVDRERGYLRAMQESGLPVDPRWITKVVATRTGGLQVARLILAHEEKPTAVFCADATTALGLLDACREAGIGVPGDMSIVTASAAAEGAEFFDRIVLNGYSLGELACRQVLERMDGFSQPRQALSPDCQIVNGSSVKAPVA
ncbi:MAG TPA: substrate-binding domain-containing protein [Planctomycetota bacterium]|nr:substrate-binding domain-containing protein [Planctomycetota bacterium]